VLASKNDANISAQTAFAVRDIVAATHQGETATN
jgi:hypothetical protein